MLNEIAFIILYLLVESVQFYHYITLRSIELNNEKIIET